MTAESVSQLLGSKRTEDRIRAVGRAARLPEPERQALLLKALHDRSNYVATQAAEALSQCAQWESGDAMAKRFLYLSQQGAERDPGCHIRGQIAYAFAALEYTPGADALRAGIVTRQIESVGGVLFDTAAHLRANCALALARIRARDAVRDISILLFDRGSGQMGWMAVEPGPRKTAAQALANLGDAAAIVPLTLRLVHPDGEDPDVLQECMQALVALEDPRAIEVLAGYLNGREPGLAAFAALMIARTGAPEAAKTIYTALQSFHGDSLQTAVLALASVRTEKARDLLLGLAVDVREDVRSALVAVLAQFGATDDVKQLAAIARDDPSRAIRTAADRALKQLNSAGPEDSPSRSS